MSKLLPLLAASAAAAAAWNGLIPGLSAGHDKACSDIVNARLPASGATREQIQEAQRAVQVHVASARASAVGAAAVAGGLAWFMTRKR
jgi:hypothetical protein